MHSSAVCSVLPRPAPPHTVIATPLSSRLPAEGGLRTKNTGPVGFLVGVGGANSVLLFPRGPWPQLGHWADPTSCLSQSSAWWPCLCLESASESTASLFPWSLVKGRARMAFGPGIFRSSQAQDLSLTCLMLGSRGGGLWYPWNVVLTHPILGLSVSRCHHPDTFTTPASAKAQSGPV